LAAEHDGIRLKHAPLSETKISYSFFLFEKSLIERKIHNILRVELKKDLTIIFLAKERNVN
jgi:hypothetical protein